MTQRTPCRSSSVWLIGWLAFVTALPAAARGQYGIETAPGDRIEPPAALLGTWGTPAQCAARGTGEPPFAYRIDREWLEQAGIYCYLSWQASFAREAGSQTHALAQCGEDTLREYRLVLWLDDAALRIRWSASYTTPELRRCG